MIEILLSIKVDKGLNIVIWGKSDYLMKPEKTKWQESWSRSK